MILVLREVARSDKKHVNSVAYIHNCEYCKVCNIIGNKVTVMTNEQLKAGRVQAGLTQIQASQRLKLSQPYLSQLERGQRPITPELARFAARVFGLSPTALPVPETAASNEVSNASRLTRQLAGLGYPGFGHLRGEHTNPAAVM